MSKSLVRHGLIINVENPKGSTRAGVGPNGSWQTVMAHDYGEIVGGPGLGADQDPVDVFLGDDADAQAVYVVNQNAPDGTFDEHKCMVGFGSQPEAESAYLANYEPGWAGMGSVAAMPVASFLKWLHMGDQSQPAAAPDPTAISQDVTAEAEDAPAEAMEDAIGIGPGEVGYTLLDAAPGSGMRRARILASVPHVPNINNRYFTPEYFRASLAKANAYVDATPRYGESPHPPFNPKTHQFDTNPLKEVWRMVGWGVDAAGNLYADVDVDTTTEQGARVSTKMDRKENIGSSVRWNHLELIRAGKSVPTARLVDGSSVHYFDAPLAPYVYPGELDHVPNPAFTQAGRVMADAAAYEPILDATQPLAPVAIADASFEQAALANAAALVKPNPVPQPTPQSDAPKEKKPLKTAAELRAQAAAISDPEAKQSLLDAADALETSTQGAVDAAGMEDRILARLAPHLANADKAATFVDGQAAREAQAAEQAAVAGIADAIVDGSLQDTARFADPAVRGRIAAKVRAKATETEARAALADAIENQDDLAAAVGLATQGLRDSAAQNSGQAQGQTTDDGTQRVQVVVEDKDKKADGWIDSVNKATEHALLSQGITPDPLLHRALQGKVDRIVGPVEARVGRQAVVDSIEFLTSPQGTKNMREGLSALRGMTDAGMLTDAPVTDAVLTTTNILQQPVLMQLVLRPLYQNMQVMKYLSAFGPDATFRAGAGPGGAGFDGGRVGGADLGRIFKFQSRYFQPPVQSTGGRTRTSGRIAENAGIPRSAISNTWQSFNTYRRALAFGMTKEVQTWTATGATPFDLLGENIAGNIALYAREGDNLGYYEMVSAALEMGCVVVANEAVNANNMMNGRTQDGITYGDGTASTSLYSSPDNPYPPQGVVCVVQPDCLAPATPTVAAANRRASQVANQSASNALRTPLVPPRDKVTVDFNNYETITTLNPVVVKKGAQVLTPGYLTADNEIGTEYGQPNAAHYAVDWMRGKIVFSQASGVTAATNNLTLQYSFATNFTQTQINFDNNAYPGGVDYRKYTDVIYQTNNTIAAQMGAHPNYTRPNVCLSSEIAAARLVQAELFDKLRSPVGTELIAPTQQTYAEYNSVMYDQVNAPSILGNDALLLFHNEYSAMAIESPLHTEGGFTGYDATGQLVARTEYMMNQFETYCTPLAQDRNGIIFNKPARFHLLV